MLYNIWECSYNMGIWKKGKSRCDVNKKKILLNLLQEIPFAIKQALQDKR